MSEYLLKVGRSQLEVSIGMTVYSMTGTGELLGSLASTCGWPRVGSHQTEHLINDRCDYPYLSRLHIPLG